MTQGTSYRASDPPTKGKSSDPLGRISDQAENVANRVAEQGREIGQQVQDAAEQVRSTVDKSIREQPLMTLAAAAVVGFALGALWKS
jgi:ElaB/YqjD/DUF883 family membrane-anchored ribosome-binding protein